MSTEIASLLVRSTDICGGRLRIDGTRITINQMAALYIEGSSPEEIADEYSHLTLAQVYTALAYYHAKGEEVDAALAVERAEADLLEREFHHLGG